MRDSRRAVRLCIGLVAALRVLAMVLTVQLSGTGHLAADALSVAFPGIAEHEEERCPPDGRCNDCPSGCPQCHCPNLVGSVAPNADSPVPVVVAASEILPTAFESQAPPTPELPLPFRPPQTDLTLS